MFRPGIAFMVDWAHVKYQESTVNPLHSDRREHDANLASAQLVTDPPSRTAGSESVGSICSIQEERTCVYGK